MLKRVAPALLLAAALTGCLDGGDKGESTRISGDTLTVYSSLPRHGLTAEAAAAVLAGQRRALRDAGGRVSGRRVRLVALDSSKPDGRGWDPGMVNANAERAKDDPTAIAYLGELDFGGSAVSLPTTNEAGLLQVSPGDGLTSLTRRPPGRPRAGPERFYPTDERSFIRLVPSDLRQAETLLALARRQGARSLAVLDDDEIYGRELAIVLASRARRAGIRVERVAEIRDDSAAVPDRVDELSEVRPGAVVYAGLPGDAYGPLMAALARRLPAVPMLGSAGLRAAPAPRAAPRTVTVLSAVRPAASYPKSGRRLLARLGDGRRPARPEALYGYESMRLVLDAVEQGGPDRAAVIKAALTPRMRSSVLGRYRVSSLGEVSENRFAAYRFEHGRLVFDRLVE
jgi:branched-chain amino acid transport system substrate-binding protein